MAKNRRWRVSAEKWPVAYAVGRRSRPMRGTAQPAVQRRDTAPLHSLCGTWNMKAGSVLVDGRGLGGSRQQVMVERVGERRNVRHHLVVLPRHEQVEPLGIDPRGVR